MSGRTAQLQDAVVGSAEPHDGRMGAAGIDINIDVVSACAGRLHAQYPFHLCSHGVIPRCSRPATRSTRKPARAHALVQQSRGGEIQIRRCQSDLRVCS